MKPFRHVFLLLPMTLALTLMGRADPLVDTIKAEAAKNAEALRKGDFETVVSLTYPKLIDLLGGRESTIAIMKSAMEQGSSQSPKIREVLIGEPGVPVASPTKLFSVVPMTMLMVSMKSNTEVTVKSFLLAISEDQGRTWKFLDGSGLRPDMISSVIPDLPATLKLPARQEPVVRPRS